MDQLLPFYESSDPTDGKRKRKHTASPDDEFRSSDTDLAHHLMMLAINAPHKVSCRGVHLSTCTLVYHTVPEHTNTMLSVNNQQMSQEICPGACYEEEVCGVEDVKHLSAQIACDCTNKIEARPIPTEIVCCNSLL